MILTILHVVETIGLLFVVYLAWATDLFWSAQTRQKVTANPQSYHFPWWFHRFYPGDSQ